MKTIVTVILLAASALANATEYTNVQLIAGSRATSVEQNAIRLLQERLTENGGPAVQIGAAPANGTANTLNLYIGVMQNHDALVAHLHDARIRPLSERDPGPEGFLIKSDFEKNALYATAVDQRGTLYAVGEILRKARILPNAVAFDEEINVRTAPAFEVRGTQYGQSGILLSKAKARPWTDAETHRDIIDSALAGANTFDVDPGPMYDYIKAMGLMTNTNYGPNIGTGPKEWEGSESIGRGGYLCPSVPEARKALLEKCEAAFKGSPPFDFVKFVGGDGGGCECDKCDPYGLTFILLCEDMAAIVHKYSPNSRIWFTNQKFDNDDDNAIFKYLQEKPRTWLWAWGYGPGSDAMSWQPGHRQTHRMDLFRYPGFGPFDRYNQEIMHQLPPEQTLMHFNEITHWRYAQHAYAQMYPRADRNGDLPPMWNHFMYERRPDQALTMVYDRLTFYAWPKFYHWIFGEVNRYGVGDITHSSGTHDHFNQWMWQRLLWAPQTSVEDIVDEYCTTWFGPEASLLMAEALFQLEQNLEEQRPHTIANKPGIDTYYNLVKQAGAKSSPHLLSKNWLWREYMQKAALDKYIKLDVIEQVDIQARVEKQTARMLAKNPTDKAIDASLRLIAGLTETQSMKSLRVEAERLGEESNALYGVRSEGLYNLEHDYIGLGWLKRQLERARATTNDTERRDLLRMIVAYDDPGEGGQYDDLGTFAPCPNVVNGYPYDHGQPYVPPMLDEGNRPSQRSLYFTQNEAQGVTLHYRDLDPKASYRIRFTFVRPWYQERYNQRMNQKSQTIYADDTILAKDVELPLQMSDFFTYDIPSEMIQDGEVVIRFEKAADVAIGDRVYVEQWRNSGGWGTLVSEAWLMKK